MKFNLILFFALFVGNNCTAEQIVLELKDKSDIPFGEISPSSFGLQYGDTLYIISNRDILGKDSSLFVYRTDSNSCIYRCFYKLDEYTKMIKSEVVFNPDYRYFIKSEEDENIPTIVAVMLLLIFFAAAFSGSRM